MFDKLLYDKLTTYCAYQERCKSDVVGKMNKLKVEKEDQGAYIERLEEENFLNEERYVKAFISAHSKKKWGRVKIKSALGQKRVASTFIKKYLDEIDIDTYSEQIKTLALKKLKTIKADTKTETRTKLLRFLLSKGFEMQQIQPVIKELKF